MLNKLAACAFSVVLVTLGAQTASADTFMDVPGIPGDATFRGYEDQINVVSLSQTLRPQTKLDGYCKVEVVKTLDIAGPLLWAAAVTGQVFPEIKFSVIQTGEVPNKIYEIVLKNARIDNIATALSDLNGEHLALSGTSTVLTYFPVDGAGSPGNPVTTSISCK